MSIKLDNFLVCGLGSLGQYCVLALKNFGVSVIAIDQEQELSWEIHNLPNLLSDLIIADCRQNDILEQAKINQCRAALLVTSSEKVNIETALAIRQLNPHTRLVIRSAKENLNHLLSEQLGNFIAFEPTELPANAFAFAALGSDYLGFFSLDGQRLQITKREIYAHDNWCNNRSLHELNTRTRRLLCQYNASFLPTAFHQWESDNLVQAGDTLIYIEVAESAFLASPQFSVNPSQKSSSLKSKFIFQRLKDILFKFWQLNFQQQVRRVALFCGITLIVLLFLGTFLIHTTYPDKFTLFSAFSATAILLLGGYGDIFGGFGGMDDIPSWLQGFSLGLTLAGTAFVGVIYALLTEALLSAKFQFTIKRPPVPQQDHVVIIGLGRIGQKIAALLQNFRFSLVGITFNLDFDRTVLPQMPLIVGNLNEILPQGNLATAKSIVIVTDDEILNLEVALMAKRINPKSHIVIRTAGQRLGEHLSQLLPDSQILGAYAVAAEAFAGAAFGENIINLFRLNNQTILVTEYEIEPGDTLNGLLLAEVAYGYGVVPILHQKPPGSSNLMPSDDIRLAIDDRMVILATMEGLRRIEQGRISITPKSWRIKVEKAFSEDSIFEGANIIARISGCPLAIARELMQNLPGILSVPLYKQQGLRLVRALSKVQVTANLLPINSQ